jgi:methionyl-tRNA formyltransferase
MNIIFMGTPDFAVPSLETIKKSGHKILSVVTQPDRPKGRGNRMSFSPVKEKALEMGLPVIQPLKVRGDACFLNDIKEIAPDVIVVVAYGQILPPEVLEVPAYGCINVHASLLPKLRGAAPINWSIINGDTETGVTTMLMEKGLDTGDMLIRRTVCIYENETAGELHDRLKVIGAQALIETLEMIEKGEIKSVPQDDSQSTYAPMLDRDTGRIEWNRGSQAVTNLVRGTNPWPGAYSFLKDTRIKIWNAEVDTDSNSGKPGCIWKVDHEGIHVCTGDGSIVIKEVQGDNGKRTDAHSYTLGHDVLVGSIFL